MAFLRELAPGQAMGTVPRGCPQGEPGRIQRRGENQADFNSEQRAGTPGQGEVGWAAGVIKPPAAPYTRRGLLCSHNKEFGNRQSQGCSVTEHHPGSWGCFCDSTGISFTLPRWRPRIHMP